MYHSNKASEIFYGDKLDL